MMQRFFPFPCLLVLLLSGCGALSSTPYSPRFVGVVGPQGDPGHLPRACLVDAEPHAGGRLPPGCANALNLLGMVADKEDLYRGKEMGPAYVAPAAAAVERYLGVASEDAVVARQTRLVRESDVSD